MWRLFRRIRAAAAVLLLPGDRMPITRHDLHELRREWQSWEMTWVDTLEKLNAWYARQAKREKRALQRHVDGASGDGTSASTDPKARKRELSRRLVSGGQSVLPLPTGAPHHPDDDGDDEP